MSGDVERLQAILDGIPYAGFLGARAELRDGEALSVMPFAPHLIGNPMLPALHGGATAAFLEMAAMAHLATLNGEATHLPRPISVSIDYLRSGRPLATVARPVVKRIGRRIANVQVEAWQDGQGAPIAALHANFLLSAGPAMPDQGK